MTQRKFPAVLMRGGTSKAIMFHTRDLPAARAEWDAILLTVGAEVQFRNAEWRATRGSFYRTARRLFDGYVYS